MNVGGREGSGGGIAFMVTCTNFPHTEITKPLPTYYAKTVNGIPKYLLP